MGSLMDAIGKYKAPEFWAIIGRTNYAVSTFGKVRSLKTGIVLKHQRSKRGGFYPFVNIYVSGTRLNFTVHKLVAEAFLGDRPAGHEIHHKDTDIDNPRADNLEYLSPEDHRKIKKAN